MVNTAYTRALTGESFEPRERCTCPYNACFRFFVFDPEGDVFFLCPWEMQVPLQRVLQVR
jgi:hypothetical protein